MNENRKEDLFNQMVKAGQRTYFINVRESKNKRRYIRITESKLIEKDKFERLSIFVFAEKAREFVGVLGKAAQMVA
ncbi:MAG: DUF3276 family protein [Candidatus Saganbacteria bacterium]|nr:DUF3276 family protein [Candidatus Saganbacteria bacterium]